MNEYRITTLIHNQLVCKDNCRACPQGPPADSHPAAFLPDVVHFLPRSSNPTWEEISAWDARHGSPPPVLPGPLGPLSPSYSGLFTVISVVVVVLISVVVVALISDLSLFGPLSVNFCFGVITVYVSCDRFCRIDPSMPPLHPAWKLLPGRLSGRLPASPAGSSPGPLPGHCLTSA